VARIGNQQLSLAYPVSGRHMQLRTQTRVIATENRNFTDAHGLQDVGIGSPADRQIETPFYLVDTHGNRAGARISDATPKVVELTAGRVRGFA
jgi:hypothetical protein